MTFHFETPREQLRRRSLNRTKTAALIGASTFTLLVGCGSLRPPATHQTPAPAASGQEARDGKLGFTVTDVSYVDWVGDPYDPFAYEEAEGVFEVIRLTVRNIGAAGRGDIVVTAQAALVAAQGQKVDSGRYGDA